MSFLNRLQPRRGAPRPEAVEELIEAERRHQVAVQRGAVVSQMSTWLDHRREKNGFGDALSISFTPRKHHA